MWTHDVAERMKIRRKALAADAGLDDSYDVGTYPDEVTTVIVGRGGGLGPLIGGVLAGGLGSLGLAAALGAFSMSGTAATVPDPPKGQEWDITIESVNGKPAVTDVEVVE